MKMLRVLALSFAATALLSIPAVIPETHAEYTNGAFLGVFTDAGSPGSFTLPVGAPFPQTGWEYLPQTGDNRLVKIRNGAKMDFHLTLNELMSQVISGSMRFTIFQLDTPGDQQALLLGSYTLALSNDSGPYQVSGPVVGDGHYLYLPGTDTNNTLDTTADDTTFLLKVNSVVIGADLSNPTYLIGQAKVAAAGQFISAATESYSGTTSVPATPAPLDAPGLLKGSVLNQFVPADGSGDAAFASDTAGNFISGRVRTGTINGDPMTVKNYVLGLSDGAGGTLKGIFLNRYTRVVPGGKTQEGLMVGDIGAAPADTSAPVAGYVFATVTPQLSPALLFGTLTGSANYTSTNLTIASRLEQVDSVPPEVEIPGDGQVLFTDRFQNYSSSVSDFNGWQDIQSVQLLVNDSLAQNRILARYDAAMNRFSLYDRSLKQWVGSCAPGAAATIKTPWVSLSCKDSTVSTVGSPAKGGAGGIVTVGWNLKPTALMLPPLFANAYVKVTDRAGLIGGWRMVVNGQEILPVGP